MISTLQRHVVGLVTELAPPALADFCGRLNGLYAGICDSGTDGVTDGISPPAVRHALREFLRVWRAEAPEVTPATMALMLQAAAAVDEHRRREQTMELVWTGPAGVGSVFRRTDQALLELIAGARKSLVVVTFAAYRVPAVVTALQEARARGVEIAMVLETVADSGGQLTQDGIDGLGPAVLALATIYAWPMEQRPRDAAGHVGCLHVKCAVADDNAALISSANLTGHALNINMELGLFVRGGPVPRQLARHLQDLMAGRQLTRLNAALP